MTDRIAQLKKFFVVDKEHHAYRRRIPLGINDICEDDKLREYEKNAKALVRVLQSEVPLVFPFEHICGTRVMLELPRWNLTPVNTDRWISHLLNEPTIGGISNNVADYENTIRVGLDGRRQEILLQIDCRSAEGDAEKVRFLNNLLYLIDAMEAYADALHAEAKKVGNTYVAGLFERIPRQGARTFAEALQFLKFLNMVVRYDNDTHSPFGRFDQYMYPYYQADIEAGRLTNEEALELVSEFFISLNRDTDILYCVQKGDNGQSMILGGVNQENVLSYNALTDLCLTASRELAIIDPKINLRVNRDTPIEWYCKGTELTKVGLGFPQYLNDDVVIPALESWGYAPEDAREYALAGCWEFIIPGCGGEVVNIEAMPFIQIVDRTLNTYLEKSATFEEFMEHFRDEMYLEAEAIEKRFAHVAIRPSTIHSLLSQQAVSAGKDLSECMRYNNFGIHGPGISNAVDSLAAIKKNVFDDKSVASADLIRAIAANYEGYEDIWRKMKYGAPKMGNDDDYVDAISVRVTDIFADAFEDRRNCYGGRFRPGTGSAMYYVWYEDEAASADGRRKGEPLSANFSPSLNVKIEGPLSMFKSFTKQNLRRICNGGPVTLELHDSVFRNPEAVAKVAELVHAYILLGGHELQLNAVNADVLRRAQQKPEEYKNLVVRVWGWSGYFVELNREYQEQIISRAEMIL